MQLAPGYSLEIATPLATPHARGPVHLFLEAGGQRVRIEKEEILRMIRYCVDQQVIHAGDAEAAALDRNWGQDVSEGA